MRINKFSKIAIILSILCCLSVSCSNKSEKGTKNNPYLISSVSDMFWFAEEVNSGNTFDGKYVCLTSNINLNGYNWNSIAPYDTDYVFNGVFDGRGHCISDIKVITTTNHSLFGTLGGVIMNLGIENGQIEGNCVGGIVSHSSSPNALVINCYSKSLLKGYRAGGIADNFNGTIVNCWSDCTLMADFIGGVVSYWAYQIENCYSIQNYLHNVSADNVTILDKSSYSQYELRDNLNANLSIYEKKYNLEENDLVRWEVTTRGLTYKNQVNQANIVLTKVIIFSMAIASTLFIMFNIFMKIYKLTKKN